MIVVATEDFRLYHAAVTALRERDVDFTTVEPGSGFPPGTRVVVAGPDDDVGPAAGDGTVVEASDAGGPPPVVVADPEDVRAGIDEALTALRGGGGRTVVGVDPGPTPGVAVLAGAGAAGDGTAAGGTVVAAFRVPLGEVVDVVRREVAGADDPLVRIGDGDRLKGARIVNELEDVPVELVDETGTTPSLGTGARGMADVLAAVNIARMEGERVDSRAIEPTEGELQRIKNESRRRSVDGRTIDEPLARRVANGELTLEEAIETHRDR